MLSSSKLVIAQPSVGLSPSGFTRLHCEMLPREVGHVIGYDPRILVQKPPRSKVARGTREIVPHNVSAEIVNLQNTIQRSIDGARVEQMVDYLLGAMERNQFADWGSIELTTKAQPDLSEMDDKHVVSIDSDAEYFIADGQHRYCALLDFIQEYPDYADRFTQSVTISVIPEDKLAQWAGQKFHDHNYFSVAVRAGKALSVDTRDPVNALTKDLAEHSLIKTAGGIAYERDTLLKADARFTSHSILHRFVRGFLFGRPGLDKGTDTRIEIDQEARDRLWEYLSALGEVLPWKKSPEERDQYLTRTSAVLSALAVIGNDLYMADPPLSADDKIKRMVKLGKMDWRKANLKLVGVVGSEREGQVAPASSRQAIDSTIRFLREKLDLSRGN